MECIHTCIIIRPEIIRTCIITPDNRLYHIHWDYYICVFTYLDGYIYIYTHLDYNT